MNIMILTWLFPPSTGGIESYTYSLAHRLAKEHKITVFTGGRKKQNTNCFKVIRINEMYPYRKSKEELEILSQRLKKSLISEKIDIVHSHNLICLPTNFSSAIIQTIRNLGIPIIDHCHDARYKNLNEKVAVKDIQKFIAVSDFVKRRLISIGCDERKIEVVHNSISRELFNPCNYSKREARKYFKLPPDKKIILFPSRAIRTTTGKFGRQKQFKTLLNSTKKIRKEFGDDFLVVFPLKVGSRENKTQRQKTLSKLEKKLDKLGIRKNIVWIDKKIEYSKMPMLYYAADIMCTPSLDEAFGLVFIESMFMGTPVIGARSGAIPEIIKNGKTGFLTNPGDSRGLAHVIIRLLRNNNLRGKIGKNAHEYATNKFSYEGMIKKINKIYFSIPRKMYLVRHPETVRNKNNRITGWENTRYSREGRRQFRKIVNFFFRHQEIIYSSDLPRCLKLAKSISGKNKQKFISTKLLRERNFKETKPYEISESNKDANRRISIFLKKYKLKDCIIISHSGIIAGIAEKLAGKGAKMKINRPRDIIFLIERNKKQERLVGLEV